MTTHKLHSSGSSSHLVRNRRNKLAVVVCHNSIIDVENEQQQRKTTVMNVPIADLLEIGHEQAEIGNYEGARVSFQQAVLQLQQQQQQQQQEHNDDDCNNNANNQREIKKQFSSIEGYQLSAILSDLGHCCAKLNRYDEAVKYWKECLHLKRCYYNYSTEGTNIESSNKNLDLTKALEDVGKALLELGIYSESKRYYNEALDMKRLIYGKQQHLTESQKALLSKTITNNKPTNNNNNTPRLVGQLGIKQQVYGYDRAQNTDVAYTLCKLGEIAHCQGHFHKARQKYTESLDMYRIAHSSSSSNNNNNNTSSFNNKISNNEVYDISNNVKHIDIAKVMVHLGHVHADMGRMKYSTIFFQQAITMVEELMKKQKQPGQHNELLKRIKETEKMCLLQQQQRFQQHLQQQQTTTTTTPSLLLSQNHNNNSSSNIIVEGNATVMSEEEEETPSLTSTNDSSSNSNISIISE